MSTFTVIPRDVIDGTRRDPRGPQPKPLRERLERLIAPAEGPDPCWLWQGRLGGGGYGLIEIAGVRMSAASVVIALNDDGRLPVGLLRRTCGRRDCVRPDHAVLMKRHLRRAAQARPSTALDPARVAEIRAALAEGGASLRAIGRRFGVSHATVSRIARGIAGRTQGEETK